MSNNNTDSDTASFSARPIFTWIGIVGGAITLFSNLEGFLKLAGWARVVVARWNDWAQAFWNFVFGWLGITIPQIVAVSLTVGSLLILSALGSRVQRGQPSDVSLTVLAKELERDALTPLFSGSWLSRLRHVWNVPHIAMSRLTSRLSFPQLIRLPLVAILLIFFAPHRTELESLLNSENIVILIAAVPIGAGLLIGRLCTSQESWATRLWFILLGLLLLVAANELAKLDLVQYLTPPDVNL